MFEYSAFMLCIVQTVIVEFKVQGNCDLVSDLVSV